MNFAACEPGRFQLAPQVSQLVKLQGDKSPSLRVSPKCIGEWGKQSTEIYIRGCGIKETWQSVYWSQYFQTMPPNSKPLCRKEEEKTEQFARFAQSSHSCLAINHTQEGGNTGSHDICWPWMGALTLCCAHRKWGSLLVTEDRAINNYALHRSRSLQPQLCSRSTTGCYTLQDCLL
jgi:hypothetical protein